MDFLRLARVSLSFLSTPSAGRATDRGLLRQFLIVISIHALRGEGDLRCAASKGGSFSISIHALRGEGDVLSWWRALFSPRFLSTPSAGRATLSGKDAVLFNGISIHALRGEGDSKNGEKHLRFCFIIKRSAQIWKSLSKNIRKNSCDLHRTA